MSRPTWSNLRNSKATADDLLRAFNVLSAPVPVEEIATGIGVQVLYVDENSWIGALDARGAFPRILVAHNQSTAQQRFVIAHELGHLLLHPLDVVYRDTESNNSDLQEIQANKFAADLLIPIWLINVYGSQRHSVSHLASIFNVPLRSFKY